MASAMYNYALDALNTVDWTSGDYRVLLVTGGYVPSKDHHFVSNLTNELVGGNYVRKALVGKTRTVDTGFDRVDFDAADVTWTALEAVAGTPDYAIVYLHNALDTAAILVACLGFSSSLAPTGADWTVQWPADYLFFAQE